MDWTKEHPKLSELPTEWLENHRHLTNPQAALLLSSILEEKVTADSVSSARTRYLPGEYMPVGEFSKHWKLFCSMIGRDVKKPLPKIQPNNKNYRKVGVACDLHGDPSMSLFAKFLKEKFDLVVWDGDIFDAYSFSRFPKDHIVPITDELARLRAILEAIECPVKLTEGNHDARARKYFESRIDPQYMELVQYNLLELLAMDLPHVEVIDNLYDFTTPGGELTRGALANSYLAHIGSDCIIGHAEIAKKGELRTVDAFAEWLDRWTKPLGWGTQNLVIQAHVHRAGIGYANGGHSVRVEGGFSGNIQTLQYAMDNGAAIYSPPVLGYTSFIQEKKQDKWVTDLSSVRFVLC